MSDISEIVPIAHDIQKTFDLCNYCLGRLFSKKLGLSSNYLLGKKLRLKNFEEKKCFICKNIFKNLKFFVHLMENQSKKYHFLSFLVGAIIKPSMVDRDDLIRSKYHLRGIDSVKTDITREIAKQFAKISKTKINPIKPDITFTVNLKDESCKIQSRPILLFGKYSKLSKGIPQKQKPCDNCSGKGCINCNFHGISEYTSVEGKISKFLFEHIGGTLAKYTWIGGEDQSSLVIGSGRPFFVKIINPKKFQLLFQKKIELDSLILHNLKSISKLPKLPLKFYSIVRIKISTRNEIKPKSLNKLKQFKDNPVLIYDKFMKPSTKTISKIIFKKITDNSFNLTMRVEGGLPIKRLVRGENVTPGITQIIKNQCTCIDFDFLDISIKR